MTETVKAKVAEHHFKKQVNIGEKTLDRDESREVEVNNTLRNMVRAGNVVITEGSLRPERDEKRFREDDESGEKGEANPGEQDLKDKTVDELKDLLEEKDLKKTGTKDELVERLKNSE